MQVDSMAVLLPRVKNGEAQAMEAVLDELNISMDEDSLHTHWASASQEEMDKIKMKDVAVREGLVPNVIGMGAKDAVYLLEQEGLRVSMTGIGRVVSQSIQPGRKLTKGQSISITLK